MSSNSNPSYDDSWEEQAFAEDAAGSLGGCIWPPRSYSCSFCRREFRSAQALGGHMNVHRKDRARLKQSTSPQNNEIQYHHDLEIETHLHKPIENPLTTTTSLADNNNLFPSPVCGLVYQTNPNSHHDFVASPSSPYSTSKALLSSSIDIGNFRKETLIPFFNSSRKFHPKVCIENVSKGDADDVDVAMSLNCIESTKKEDINCKKRKIDASSNHFFPKRSSFDRHQHHMQVQVQPKMFEFSPSSIEELDLELRL